MAKEVGLLCPSIPFAPSFRLSSSTAKRSAGGLWVLDLSGIRVSESLYIGRRPFPVRRNPMSFLFYLGSCEECAREDHDGISCFPIVLVN